MAMNCILLLNGPNLDMLGTREPEVYGRQTLGALEELARQYGSQRGIAITAFQSNSEAKLIECIHNAPGLCTGIVYNPGAHTHYSYALRDAIASIDLPVVEVHISDVGKREPFRNVSVIAPACVAQVKGMGFDGYLRAIDILCNHESFSRLEEGFESRYDTNQPIIIANVSPIQEPGGLAGTHAELQAIAAQPDVQAPITQGIEAPAPQPIADAQVALRPTAATPAAAHTPAPNKSEVQTPAQADAADSTQVLPPQSPSGSTSVDDALEQDFTAAYAQQIAQCDSGQISQERQAEVRKLCAQLGLGALLVRDTSNIRWITAIDGVFDDEPAHALVLDGSRAVLHTDSRYANAARAAAAQAGEAVTVDERRTSHAQFARELLSPEGSTFPGMVGIEDTITYAEFAKTVEALGAENLMSTNDLVRGLRAVKSGAELSRLLAAQAVTDAAFAHIVRFMRPGMTEREVQLELDWYMLRHGAEGLAFSSIVATGANGADPHAIPGDTKLEAGQCVVMDFGAKAFGYCSDMTRTVFLGQPDAKMASAWEVLRQANETVEASLHPGVTGKEAHEMAERILEQGGFGGKMGHGLGHGVGIDVHELPVLNTRNDQPLVVGNVVTVEPGIYLPGEFGMRLEDCGVITHTGYETFSRIGHDMIVL